MAATTAHRRYSASKATTIGEVNYRKDSLMKRIKNILEDIKQEAYWMRSDRAVSLMLEMPLGGIIGLVEDVFTIEIIDKEACSDLLGLSPSQVEQFATVAKPIRQRKYDPAGHAYMRTVGVRFEAIQFWSQETLEAWLVDYFSKHSDAAYGVGKTISTVAAHCRTHELLGTFVKLLKSGAIVIARLQMQAHYSRVAGEALQDNYNHYWSND